jgi:hypothetical protein
VVVLAFGGTEPVDSSFGSRYRRTERLDGGYMLLLDELRIAVRRSGVSEGWGCIHCFLFLDYLCTHIFLYILLVVSDP